MNKNYKEQSLFTPENLLRDARRQKSIDKYQIPRVCILDPDGDIVKYLCKKKLAKVNESWACYHTTLFVFKVGRIKAGIVGCAVGASFAVLVAEEMFASGCELLISITSAGKICPRADDTRFLLIAKALRDEGTSFHYTSPSIFSKIDQNLLRRISSNFHAAPMPVSSGISWTTDAPFRETWNRRHSMHLQKRVRKMLFASPT
jgi:uridine phosphorylase